MFRIKVYFEIFDYIVTDYLYYLVFNNSKIFMFIYIK